MDPAINFAAEDNQENSNIPFLDTLVKPEADNFLSITVHRKPMHTDQYIQWDSHHNLAATYSVISLLTHRAKTVCTMQDLLNRDINHIRKLLTKCKYPKWALDKVERKLLNNNQENSNTQGDSRDDKRRDPNNAKYSMGHIVIPYM